MAAERPTVGVLVFKGKNNAEVLLLRRTGRLLPGFAWPGGLLDNPDKTPIQQAIDEVREETGIILDPSDLIPWKHSFPTYVDPKSGVAYPLEMFVCAKHAGTISPPVDSTEEIADAQWARVSSLPEPISQRHRDIIQAGHEYLQNIQSQRMQGGHADRIKKEQNKGGLSM